MLELKRARIRVLKEKNARLAGDIVAGRETHEAELNEAVAKYLEVVEESAKAKIAYEEATSELKARIRRLSSKKVQEAQRAEEATKQLEELEVQMSEADKEKARLKSVVRALKAERKEETRELRFILRHLREELPEFMHDQTSLTIDDLCELPVYFKQNYMDFLTQLRDSFRPFLEEGSLGGVFRTMTLSLFPELSPTEYDRIVSGFTHTPPSSGSDVFENAPTAKLSNR
jgi:rRNA maturation endonuclease Nob1